MPYCIINTNLSGYHLSDKFHKELEELLVPLLENNVAVELNPNRNVRYMGSKSKIWFFVHILKIGHEAEKAANDKIIKTVTDFIMKQKFPGLEDDGLIIYLTGPQLQEVGFGSSFATQFNVW